MIIGTIPTLTPRFSATKALRLSLASFAARLTYSLLEFPSHEL
jgi:hypothetical protein